MRAIAEYDRGPLYDLIVSQEEDRGWRRFVCPVAAGLLVCVPFIAPPSAFSVYPFVALSMVVWFLSELEASHRVGRMISTGFLRDYALAGSSPVEVARDLNDGFRECSQDRLLVFQYVCLPPLLWFMVADYSLVLFFVLLVGCIRFCGSKWNAPIDRPSFGIRHAITKATGRRVVGKRLYNPVNHNLMGIVLFTLGCLAWESISLPVWLTVVTGWVLLAVAVEKRRAANPAYLLPAPSEWDQFVELVAHAMGGEFAAAEATVS